MLFRDNKRKSFIMKIPSHLRSPYPQRKTIKKMKISLIDHTKELKVLNNGKYFIHNFTYINGSY